MLKKAVYSRVLCPAKLNLVLRVGPQRSNRYHDLETLMVPLNWGDELSMKVAEAGQTDIELSCSGMDHLPSGSNLAFRAAYEFCKSFGKKLKIRIILKKRVPTGAGLGGGSSDAGTVLRLLAGFSRKKIDHRVKSLAVRLGADVPFFLSAEPAWCEGLGEKCQPVKLPRQMHFVLVHSPRSAVPTPWAYRQLDLSRGRDVTRLSGRAPEWILDDFDIPRLENDFEPVILNARPALVRVQRALCEAGALATGMSGSGASFYGVFPSRLIAQRAARGLVLRGFWAHSCASLK